MSNPDYSGIGSCSYGTSAFQLETYSARAEAVVFEGLGRVQTRWEVECRGYLEGAGDVASLNAAAAALNSDLQIDGRDLIIKGIGGATELQISASTCIDGGPHIDFNIGEGRNTNTRDVTIRVRTRQIPNTTTALDSFRVTTAFSADGLRTITRNGQINGPNVAAYFLKTTIPLVQAAYPWPTWTLTYQYEMGGQSVTPQSPVQQVTLNYTFTARENLSRLPGDNQNSFAVSGTASKRTERDEQMRLTTTIEFDLLVVGDPMAIVTLARPTDRTVLRETIDIETLRENHVRASFTILEGGDGGDLMNWTETVRITRAEPTWIEKTFIGAPPILVRGPDTFGRITQSGSATGQGTYKQEPDSVITFLERPREISLDDQNVVEKQTTWSYAGFVADDDGTPSDTPAGKLPFDPTDISRAAQDDNFYAQKSPPTDGNAP